VEVGAAGLEPATSSV